MSLKEAIELGKRCISEAVFNDSGSGGFLNLYHIHDGKWDPICKFEDNNELIWKDRESKKSKFLHMDKLIN